MRRLFLIVAMFLVVIVVGLGAVALLFPPAQTPKAGDRSPSQPSRTHVAPVDEYKIAAQLVAARRLRDAQDQYLRILAATPDDRQAMQGLVTVRRLMAGNDPEVLKRQADQYQLAIARGVETPEHYTVESMGLLAHANLMAAIQIEQEHLRSLSVTTPKMPAAPRFGSGAPSSPVPAMARLKTFPPASAVARSGGSLNGKSSARHILPGQSTAAAVRYPAPARSPNGAQPVPPTPSGTQVSHRPNPLERPAALPPGLPRNPQAEPAAPSPGPAISAAGAASIKRSQGRLKSVNCRMLSFLVQGSNGGQEFSTTPTTVVYAGIEKLAAGVCALQHYLGLQVLVWATLTANGLIAQRIDVLGSPPVAVVRDHEKGDGGSDNGIVILRGVVTTTDPSAVLVVSSSGPRPVVVTQATIVGGLRSTFAAIARYDTVRVSGRLTSMGTLVAKQIEVMSVSNKRVTGRITSTGPGFVVINGSIVVRTTDATVVLAGGQLGSLSDLRVGEQVSVAGTSLSGGASSSATNGGAGGPAVPGGATINAGASPSAGGTVTGTTSGQVGGTSVSAGASVNASGGGGASVNANGIEVSTK